MLHTLKLLLPALVPSWRFFDVIAPSPRIEYATTQSECAIAEHWQEFRPRPDHVSFVTMMKRLLWNPDWNESLFLVSCAERIAEGPDPHSEYEILRRIGATLIGDAAASRDAPYLRFRLVFITRHGDQIERTIGFTSEAQLYRAASAT